MSYPTGHDLILEGVAWGDRDREYAQFRIENIIRVDIENNRIDINQYGSPTTEFSLIYSTVRIKQNI